MPKKAIKMDLGSFLKDEQFGGGDWADDFDVNDLSAGLSNQGSVGLDLGGAAGKSEGGFRSYGGASGSASEDRYKHDEYPVPDKPPYTARVNNLAHEMDESVLYDFFVDGLKLDAPRDQITDFYAPKDQFSGDLRGFAFVTFSERGLLEKALTLSPSPVGGRTIYVSVAAPDRHRGGDFGSRGSAGGRMPGDAEPVLDWGSARNTREAVPQRERRSYSSYREGSESGERPERRPEPVLDWGSARNARETVPQREPRSFSGAGGDRDRDRERPARKPEPVLDWGSARNSQEATPQRSYERSGSTSRSFSRRSEKPAEPELDWGSARNTREEAKRPVEKPSAYRPPHSPRAGSGSSLDWTAARESSRRGSSDAAPRQSPRVKKTEPALDWANFRGSGLKELAEKRSNRGSRSASRRSRPAASASATPEKDVKSADRPKKSQFEVLMNNDEDEDSVSKPASKPAAASVAAVTKAVGSLTVDDGWSVAGKK